MNGKMPTGKDLRNPESEEFGWEQRWHPLLREWVVYSAHRQNRPWSGQLDAASECPLPAYDPECYLCPGNLRIGGADNPDYEGVYVFDNDRPSLSFDAPDVLTQPSGIYRNKPATGLTRVICYSPDHNLSMSELTGEQVAAVAVEWQKQTHELAGLSRVRSVSIFENKGTLCGMSNPHPHGQIYATNFIYRTTQDYLEAAAEHHRKTGRKLFADILDAEIMDGRRIIAENDTAIVFVPYFARFAYEVYVVPKRSAAHLTALTDGELSDVAALLRDVLIRMDNLWCMPFPYLLMVHQAPVDGRHFPLFHCHIAIYPPLRAPKLRKHVAAHEIGGGNFLADTMPEDKAAELRATSTLHYKAR